MYFTKEIQLVDIDEKALQSGCYLRKKQKNSKNSLKLIGNVDLSGLWRYTSNWSLEFQPTDEEMLKVIEILKDEKIDYIEENKV